MVNKIDAVAAFTTMVVTHGSTPRKMVPYKVRRDRSEGMILYDLDGHEVASSKDMPIDWTGIKHVFINAMGEVEGVQDIDYHKTSPDQLVVSSLVEEAVEHGADNGDWEMAVGDLEELLNHCVSLMSKDQVASLVNYARMYVFDFDSYRELLTHKVHFRSDCGNVVIECSDRPTVLAWLSRHELLQYVDYIEKPRQPVFGDHPFATLVAEVSGSAYCEKCPVAGIMMGCTTESIRELKESLSHNV